jgi:hypothetical protein
MCDDTPLEDRWLDDQHVLEPVDERVSDLSDTDPIVRDIDGRTWRLRRRAGRDDEGWRLVGIVALALAILILVFVATL